MVKRREVLALTHLILDRDPTGQETLMRGTLLLLLVSIQSFLLSPMMIISTRVEMIYSNLTSL